MHKDTQHIFISYARTNQAIVYPLVDRLRRIYNAWIDRSMLGGVSYPTELAEKIAHSAALVVFLSQDSVASNAVLNELNTAVAQNIFIIPYLLEDCKVPALISSPNWIYHSDPDAFGKLLDTLSQSASSARIHPGKPIDEHLKASATIKKFAEVAVGKIGVLKPIPSQNEIIGLPIHFTRYHAAYLFGLLDDVLARQDTIQIALQVTGAFPGDDFPRDVADYVVDTLKLPLRLILIRGPLAEDRVDPQNAEYDYRSAHVMSEIPPFEEWEDGGKMMLWVIENTYGIKPNRVQVFIKGPAALAFHLGHILSKSITTKFEIYHLDRVRQTYFQVF